MDCHFLLQGIFQFLGSNPVSYNAGRFFTDWATREGHTPDQLYSKYILPKSDMRGLFFFLCKASLFYCNRHAYSLIYFLFFLILFNLTLQYCIGFAIYQNESATGIHVFPILNPPPSSLPIPSLWVVPVHQPQASSIVHQTWTGDSFHIWNYTYFNAILPNHPTLSLSHRVQKTVLYISVSFAPPQNYLICISDKI